MDQIPIGKLATAFQLLDKSLAEEQCRVILLFQGFRFRSEIEWPGERDIEPTEYVAGWVQQIAGALGLPHDWTMMLPELVPVGTSMIGRYLAVDCRTRVDTAKGLLGQLARLFLVAPDQIGGIWETYSDGVPEWGNAEAYEIGMDLLSVLRDLRDLVMDSDAEGSEEMWGNLMKFAHDSLIGNAGT